MSSNAHRLQICKLGLPEVKDLVQSGKARIKFHKWAVSVVLHLQQNILIVTLKKKEYRGHEQKRVSSSKRWQWVKGRWRDGTRETWAWPLQAHGGEWRWCSPLLIPRRELGLQQLQIIPLSQQVIDLSVQTLLSACIVPGTEMTAGNWMCKTCPGCLPEASKIAKNFQRQTGT